MVRPPRDALGGVSPVRAGLPKKDQPMTAQDPKPPSLDDLEARLEALRRRQGLARDGGEGPGGKPTQPASAMGMAFRVGVELAAGLAVGGAMGWFLDGWLGTRPFLMLIFFALGAAAGMLNVVLTARAMNAPDGKNDRI